MAKYSKKKKKQPQKKQTQNKGNTGKIVLLVILSVLLAALVWLGSVLGQREVPTLEQGGQPEQNETGEVQQTQPGQSTKPESTEPPVMELSDGLVIHYISSYAGIYMEDGTNEPVADVMMIILGTPPNRIFSWRESASNTRALPRSSR